MVMVKLEYFLETGIVLVFINLVVGDKIFFFFFSFEFRNLFFKIFRIKKVNKIFVSISLMA